MSKLFLPKDIDILVVSFGGVGTTFLMEFLSKYKKTNDPHDADGFKHIPIPPIILNRNTKVLYVYGNPKDAIKSLFRRGLHYQHSKKMQKFNSILSSPVHITLERYAQQMKDNLFIENHFYNWFEKCYCPVPILFVKYEAIFKKKKEIIQYFDLPTNSIDKFPSFIERKSSKINISECAEENLEYIYHNLTVKFNKLDQLTLRSESTGNKILIPYFKKIYIRALLIQVLIQPKLLTRRYFPSIYFFLQKKLR